MLLSGNPTLLRWLDVSKDNTQTLLDKELSKLVSEFENKKIAADSTMQQTMPEATKKSGNSPAKMKRQKLRRARTKNGLLISSLRKKIYHCNCIDCQAKRKSQGKPAYLEPIGKELFTHISRICKLNKDLLLRYWRNGSGWSSRNNSLGEKEIERKTSKVSAPGGCTSLQGIAEGESSSKLEVNSFLSCLQTKVRKYSDTCIVFVWEQV